MDRRVLILVARARTRTSQEGKQGASATGGGGWLDRPERHQDLSGHWSTQGSDQECALEEGQEDQRQGRTHLPG